ncbi:MAG: alpha-glycosidase, partial [Lachnospiraceae bacterium]|nr:alpha-glycosidase [Lachnospiraceae bacterium]
NEDQDLIGFHRELIKIHRTYPAVRTGSFRMLHCEHGILSFGRFDREDQFFIAVNNNDSAKIVTFSVEELGINSPFLVSLMLTSGDVMVPEARLYSVTDGKLSLTMPAFSSFVLKNFNLEAKAE